MAVIKGVLRLLSTVLLAVAVILAVIDATRSIAANALVTTPLAEAWRDTFPDSFVAFTGMVAANLPEALANFVTGSVLGLPGFAVFAVLALLVYMIASWRRRAGDRFALPG